MIWHLEALAPSDQKGGETSRSSGTSGICGRRGQGRTGLEGFRMEQRGKKGIQVRKEQSEEEAAKARAEGIW